MELTNKQAVMLFPTPIFAGKVSDITACDRIEKKLREMQRAGQGVPHKWGKSAFFTKDDIHTLPEMKELVDLVMAELKGILDEYKVKRRFPLHHLHVGEYHAAQQLASHAYPCEFPVQRDIEY